MNSISATASPMRPASVAGPTPYERDLKNYGEVGAKVLGGARAVADVAGASIHFSPAGTVLLANESTASTGATRSEQAATKTAISGLDGVGDMLSGVEHGLVTAASSVAVQATNAYRAVAEMSAHLAKGAAHAEEVLAGAVSAVGDGLNTAADDLAGLAVLAVGAAM